MSSGLYGFEDMPRFIDKVVAYSCKSEYDFRLNFNDRLGKIIKDVFVHPIIEVIGGRWFIVDPKITGLFDLKFGFRLATNSEIAEFNEIRKFYKRRK